MARTMLKRGTIAAVMVLVVALAAPASAADETELVSGHEAIARGFEPDPDGPVRSDRQCMAVIVSAFDEHQADAQTASVITSLAPSRMYLTVGTHADVDWIADDLTKHGIEVVVVVGGSSAVPDLVPEKLYRSKMFEVRVAAGSDRADTAHEANELAAWMLDGGWWHWNRDCRWTEVPKL